MKRYRSSVTGKYVSKEFAEKHPKQTVAEEDAAKKDAEPRGYPPRDGDEKKYADGTR